MTIRLDDIQREIESTNARWVAKHDPLLDLTPAQRERRLGVVVDPQKHARSMSRIAAPVGAAVAKIDWRAVNQHNYVTSVKDQGNCGSCVSFAAAAMTESMAAIQHNVVLDLAEADLHFCSSHGANCAGWWPEDALDQIHARGVIPEEKFPYQSAFDTDTPRCLAVPDHERYATKLAESHPLASVAERKAWLSNVGPVCAVFQVFQDFFAYGSGVYHHTTGAVAGLHCVQVIGYDDGESCWIAKNSWGDDWGDQGFFKIRYGECSIDDFAFWGARGVSIPEAVTSLPLTVTVHLQGLADRTFHEDEFAGTKNEARRLEGFSIQLMPPVPDLTMEYMAHLEGTDDTQWIKEGQFVGTRGESRRLEGFAIRLAGASAGAYTVSYMAHLEDIGDSAFFSDGEFCGTRGQSRRVEAIRVRVNRR